MGQSVLEISVADGAATIAPLVLGYRNGARAGEIIQLTRPKCYLGAGGLSASESPQANLSGVHCLILRGPKHTVVRRWSPAARLNGRPFDDAALKTGDRLQLGAVELEVLADAAEETLIEWRLWLGDRVEVRREVREALDPSRENDLARRAGAFERKEFELQQQSEQTLQFAQELHRRQVLLDTLAGEVCARENEIKRHEAANAQLRFELDAQAEALDCINERLNQKRAAAETEQTRQSGILQDRITAWEAQQAAAAAVLAARETAIAQTEARLAERDNQIYAAPTADDGQSDLRQARQSIAHDRSLVDQARAEIEQARHEINTQRESLLHEQRRQAQLDSALAERAAQLDQVEAQRVQQICAIEKQRAELEIDGRRLAAEHAAFAETQRVAAHAQAELLAVTERARSNAEAQAAAELERSRSELLNLQQQIASRESQLEERLAAYSAERAEFAALQEDFNNLQREHQAQQQLLAERDNELAQRQQAFEQQLDEHQRRLEQITAQEQQLADRAAELDAIADSHVSRLESQRGELAHSQASFAADCSLRQDELAAARARLDEELRRQGEVNDEIERQRLELANRQALLDKQSSELAAEAHQLEERERLLLEREQQLAERDSTPDSRLVESPSEVETLPVDSAAPESTEAVFRRLGVMSLLRETPEDAESKDYERSDLPAATTRPIPEAPAVLNEHEESQIIERYMSQLLSRVRGGSTDTISSTTIVKPVKEPTPVAPKLPAEGANPTGEMNRCECPAPTTHELTALSAQRTAKITSSDISAMRDLANQSAQAAIDTHTRGILLNDLYVKTIVCLTGIVAGIVLLSWVPQIGVIGLLAGAACFVGSVVWGIQLGLLLREFLKASGVAGLDQKASAADSTIVASPHHPVAELNDPAN